VYRQGVLNIYLQLCREIMMAILQLNPKDSKLFYAYLLHPAHHVPAQTREIVLDVLIRSFAKGNECCICPWIHPAEADRTVEQFLIDVSDGDSDLIRLLHLIKLTSGLEVGEVWYILADGIITSVSIWSPPGYTLSDS
jgi:hypothetical protein